VDAASRGEVEYFALQGLLPGPFPQLLLLSSFKANATPLGASKKKACVMQDRKAGLA
jgi:hypothetical protein